jgi:hypothetical protein
LFVEERECFFLNFFPLLFLNSKGKKLTWPKAYWWFWSLSACRERAPQVSVLVLLY